MKYLITIILLFQGLHANAARDGFHGFVALGITYTPSSYRIGYNDWEFGMLNQVYGFDKIFDIDKNLYSTFGIVYTPAAQPGAFVSMGWKSETWIIHFRSELAAYMDFRGSSFASALIGVGY